MFRRKLLVLASLVMAGTVIWGLGYYHLVMAKEPATGQGVSLEEAINTARENAYSVKKKAIAVEKANLDYERAKRGVENTRFLFGYASEAKSISKDQAEAAVGVAEEDLLVEKENVKAQVQKAYFDVLKAEDQLQVARGTLARVTEQKRIAEESLKVGTITPADLAAAGAGLARAEMAVEAARVQRQNAVLALNKLLGRDLDLEVVLSTKPSMEFLDGVAIQDVIQALAARPEVKRMAQLVELYQKQKEAAAEYVISPLDEQSLDIGIRQSALDKQEMEVTLELQVRQLWNTLQLQQKVVEVNEKQVDAARESARVLRLKSGAGMATPLQVMEAENNLAQQQAALTSSEYDYLYTKTLLLNLAGDGLSS